MKWRTFVANVPEVWLNVNLIDFVYQESGSISERSRVICEFIPAVLRLLEKVLTEAWYSNIGSWLRGPKSQNDAHACFTWNWSHEETKSFSWFAGKRQHTQSVLLK